MNSFNKRFPTGMPIKVFVVEDEMIVALDIQNRLQQLGYQVVGTAFSSESALVQIGELLPDVVLLDVSLESEMDGLEVAAKVREQLHIPIVFLTAFSDAQMMGRIQVTEPFAYVLKPFEIVELHAALQIASTRATLERRLIEQKQLLTATLDSIADGVIVSGDDGTIQFMNPAAERLTGWNMGEAACRPLHDVYQLTDDGRLTAKDGTQRRVEAQSHLMKDDIGNWLGFVHAFADVTEREASHRALLERDVEYRILMEQAADAIVLFDEQGRLLAINSKTCELSAFSREELLGMSIQDLMYPEDLANNPVPYASLRAGSSLINERRVRRKDGTAIYVEIHAKALSDGRLQGILRDITVRKDTEEHFKDAVRSEVVDKLLQKLRTFAHGESAATNLNRIALFSDNPDALFASSAQTTPDPAPERFRIAAEEFLAVIAPELLIVSSLSAVIEADPSFGTIGQALIGVSAELRQAVSLLQSDLPAVLVALGAEKPALMAKEQHIRLQGLGAAVTTIQDILKNFLQLLHTELTCNVTEILTLTLHRFTGVSSPVVITLENSLMEERALMKGAELSDVLSSLVQNSIDALSSTGKTGDKKVTIRAKSDRGRVQIEVIDNGPGISEEHRKEIFEDSFSTKGAGRGFGLGNSLRCLQGCGGTLRMDPAVKEGATFVVELVKV
jgi:PAS domain S-box-containing protein